MKTILKVILPLFAILLILAVMPFTFDVSYKYGSITHEFEFRTLKNRTIFYLFGLALKDEVSDTVFSKHLERPRDVDERRVVVITNEFLSGRHSHWKFHSLYHIQEMLKNTEPYCEENEFREHLSHIISLLEKHDGDKEAEEYAREIYFHKFEQNKTLEPTAGSYGSPLVGSRWYSNIYFSDGSLLCPPSAHL